MSSRCYFTPQAGREGKSGVKKEDEWGTTTSQAEFRGYEPAEMRDARDAPRHAKTCMESNSGRGTQPKGKGPPSYAWHRLQEAFPDHSAYTATEQSLPRLSGTQRSQGSKPAWASTHLNPIPQKKFHATSSYTQHQLAAQQARHGHFPYRDEFAPRSKRLLYEMAHQRVSRDSVASGSTDSASAYTMSSRQSDSRRSAARSQSESSLAASSHHTADSDRVIGGIAKRRGEAQYKSPSLWPPDQEWFQQKWEKEGPAGLAFANFKPSYYMNTCKQDIEQTHSIKALLGGQKEQEITGG